MTESALNATMQASMGEAVRLEYGVEDPGPIRFQTPPDPALGDYAFGCFHLAKSLRAAPAAIASRLVPHLEKSALFEEVRAAGPYINLRIDRPFLARTVLEAILDDPEGYGRGEPDEAAPVLIEYSAPNTNKPQHLGHVRNNLLGISLVNILREAGHKVIAVNLINDRGIHICKSMLAYSRFGEGLTPEQANMKGDHFVGQFYVRYDQEEEKEFLSWKKGKTGDEEHLRAAFLKESRLYGDAQEMLKKWEAGDADTKALWEKMNAWVYEGFDATYARLGCCFDKVYRESETYGLGKELVREGLEKGVFYRKEDGSVWVDLTGDKLDQKLLLRRDGTSVYITQDLGTTKLKFEDFRMGKALWIVADEQIYHFQALFACLEKLGFPWAGECLHLAYGMVDLPEGKMKSRKGTVVDADDLMDALYDLEIEEIRSRHPDLKNEDLAEIAETLAQGALKLFILKVLPKTRMTFNPKESISPEGFTGPYIQYAYVRIQSIFRKAKEHAGALDLGTLTQPEETAVIRRLNDYPEEVRLGAESYNPSRLCSYLFELARDYNRFYHERPVLAAEDDKIRFARLALSQATAVVLRKGLALLGIGVPEHM